MEQKEAMKPCPFCGSENVGFHYVAGRKRGNHCGFFVKCKDCGGAGAIHFNGYSRTLESAENAAIESWNARACECTEKD